MKVKDVIKILQTYNPNAEVRIMTDRGKGDTTTATIIGDIEEGPQYIGFTRGMIKEIPPEERKKKTKKVVIA